MTAAPHRPRRLLVAAGLAAAALTVLRDRDLAALPRLVHVIEAPGAIPPPPPDPRPLPTRRLVDALQAHQDLTRRVADAFDPWLEALPPGKQAMTPDHPAWAPYWRQRAEAWPELVASLASLADAAMTLRAEAPDNGAFEVVAGLADVLRATSPKVVEPLSLAVDDDEAMAALLRVDDAPLLARGLARLDAGLARPLLTFDHDHEVRARRAAARGAPIERLAATFAASANIALPELMFLKEGARQLVGLARAERLAGRSGEALLARARRLALRQGGDATFIIDLLVAHAELGFVHDAWAREVVARGDAARALAVAAERAEVQRLRDEARRLPDGLSLAGLGVLDDLLMPAGGWKGGSFDPTLGRAADHALLESAIMHGLLLVIVLVSLPSAWAAAASRPAAPTPTMAGAPVAGWTLGDTLAVVLPSFGAMAILALLHTRLHPSRALGLASRAALETTAAQVGVLVLVAPLLFTWLLRRRVLARHGLQWRRPAWALAGLLLALAGLHLALLWAAGREQALLAAGVTLSVAGALAAWRGGALGGPGLDPALRRHEGRVAMASLGVALALVAAVECALVAPRRDALWRAYGVQLEALLDQEAVAWDGGKVRDHLRALLTTAPDGPRLPD